MSPLYFADLKVLAPDYRDFIYATREILLSKRVLGPVLVHEVTANEWLQDGLVLDVGVFLGSSTRLLAKLLNNRTTVHGFDTFSGFPDGKAWHIDGFEFPSKFAHNESWVQVVVAEHGLDFVDGTPSTLGHNVVFHRGLTYDTLQPVLDANREKPLTFMHVDIDTYEGAFHALETCRKRMVVGTTIVFDDFFIMSGEFKAFYDFQRKYPFQYTWTAWGHDIGFMNVISFKSLLACMVGWNYLQTKVWQAVLGLRWSSSWTDYWISVVYAWNNAVGLRVTGIGKLHDD